MLADLAFGSVVLEQESTRTLKLRNTGLIDGKFKCSFDPSSPLRIKAEPQDGVVPAGGELEVVVTLTPNELGGFATPLEVRARKSASACGVCVSRSWRRIAQPLAADAVLGEA